VKGHEHPIWCEALYEAKAAELILYGRALGLSHGEAEDVVQETFLALMQIPQRPREPERYCVRCFRNRARNHRRSLWRRLTRELESRRWFEKSPGESETERVAMTCLAGLPEAQREAIVLKIWHRFTFEEIGELLDISPNTAAGRYRYGLQKLKLQLAAVAQERSGAPWKGTVYERERDEITGEPVALLAAAPAVGDASVALVSGARRERAAHGAVRRLADAGHRLRARRPGGREFGKCRPCRRFPAFGYHGDGEQPGLRGVCDQPAVGTKQFVRRHF
jgi:RNA polymerase sigma-70 factor, ECF subfamily